MNKFIIFTVLFLSACTTQSLWENKPTTEYIDGFYYNKARNELLVSTGDNGYIFKVDNNFGDALIQSRKINFRPVFYDFIVDENNVITGSINLILSDKSINSKTINKLKKLGFQTGDSKNLHLTRFIKGKYYKIPDNLPLKKLDKKLAVKITKPESYVEQTGKIIATPATLLVDAVGYIITIPIIGMMMVITEVAGP